MSLKLGNEYSKQGLYDKAIDEYKKIDKLHPLHKQADFNMQLLEKKLTVRKAKIDTCDTKRDFCEISENTPTVSVIIPVYNVEPYLRQCLDSVINQTLKNIEIICVDDGSTDNSFSILNEYIQKDSRFIIVRQKNSGAG
ncbi:MAG: glycosyltransferase, partial [Campylobacteraceae bacterium]|nr:glycosyltransferase [Campylobacteraceae bacterium]